MLDLVYKERLIDMVVGSYCDMRFIRWISDYEPFLAGETNSVHEIINGTV